MLRFEHPESFFLLLLIPLLFLLRKLKIFEKFSYSLNMSDWKGKSFVWSDRFFLFFYYFSEILYILGFVFAVIACASPVISSQKKIYTSRGSDILFVLDTSPSMASKDIGLLTRFDAAKQAIHVMTESNKGASFGIVATAAQAALVVPPTMDHELFLQRLDSLLLGELGDGSALGTGMITAIYHLSHSKAPKKCIVLITDGENNADSIHPETAAKLAAENNITLYTLAIGNKGSAPLEYVDPKTGKVYSGILESDFDSTYLEKIAAAGNGRNFTVGDMQGLLSGLELITTRQRVVQSYIIKNINETYYDKFILLSLCSFLFFWILRKIVLREAL